MWAVYLFSFIALVVGVPVAAAAAFVAVVFRFCLKGENGSRFNFVNMFIRYEVVILTGIQLDSFGSIFLFYISHPNSQKGY